MTDLALERATQILERWREGQSMERIADDLGVAAMHVKSLIQLIVTPEERETRRAKLSAQTRQRFSDETLIEMLRACAAEYQVTPGNKRFDRWCGHYWGQLLIMRFGSWAEACRRAGLEPNARPSSPEVGKVKYSVDDYRRAYSRIKALLNGSTMSIDAWARHVQPGEPKVPTIRRRWGGWANFKTAMEQSEEER